MIEVSPGARRLTSRASEISVLGRAAARRVPPDLSVKEGLHVIAKILVDPRRLRIKILLDRDPRPNDFGLAGRVAAACVEMPPEGGPAASAHRIDLPQGGVAAGACCLNRGPGVRLSRLGRGDAFPVAILALCIRHNPQDRKSAGGQIFAGAGGVDVGFFVSESVSFALREGIRFNAGDHTRQRQNDVESTPAARRFSGIPGSH